MIRLKNVLNKFLLLIKIISVKMANSNITLGENVRIDWRTNINS
jgi:hypothetical protein